MNMTSKRPLFLGTASLILAAATLYGCKDFLSTNATPQGTLDQGTLSTQAGVEGSLIAAYRTLDCTNATSSNWGCAASDWVWGSVPSDDAYKGSEASDQPPINDIEAYHWSTGDAESYLDNKWRAVYEGVVRANATLRLLKTVNATPGAISTADAASIEGEALFLRAHYHFEAWRMWGNIPYYKEDETDFRKANGTSAAAIALIIADLDAAIAKLPTTPRSKGRVSQWTAKAYKGRAQVYAGLYAAALITLRDVRTNGPYALEASFDKVWTGFASAENGKETILAYEASANDGEPNGNDANYGERLNFPHGGSHSGCCGFHQPSQNLVNFYAVDATGLPLALSDPNWNVNNTVVVAGSTTAFDPRMDWTVGRDNVPYKDWGLHSPTWIRSLAYGGPYSPKKNAHEIASGSESKVGWVNTQLNAVNIHIFRYADMLLLLAESEVEAGVVENARAIINEIRTRAGVTAQGCGLPADAPSAAAEVAAYPTCAGDARIAVPINDPSIKWATYRVGLYPVPFASQAAARTAVQYERRAELAMEGQRFFDLQRLGIAAATLNAYVTVEKTRRPYLVAAEAFAARHRYYPIPAIQIELSKVGQTSRLTQNTGW
jgi:starch-binding outer membrane protein, SusD/RagB family